jgi:hypothetical protein
MFAELEITGYSVVHQILCQAEEMLGMLLKTGKSGQNEVKSAAPEARLLRQKWLDMVHDERARQLATGRSHVSDGIADRFQSFESCVSTLEGFAKGLSEAFTVEEEMLSSLYSPKRVEESRCTVCHIEPPMLARHRQRQAQRLTHCFRVVAFERDMSWESMFTSPRYDVCDNCVEHCTECLKLTAKEASMSAREYANARFLHKQAKHESVRKRVVHAAFPQSLVLFIFSFLL